MRRILLWTSLASRPLRRHCFLVIPLIARNVQENVNNEDDEWVRCRLEPEATEEAQEPAPVVQGNEIK